MGPAMFGPLEVPFSTEVSDLIFHVAGTEATDERWNWPDIESLLWVLDNGTGLRLWQDFQHQPRVADGGTTFAVQAILGDYQYPLIIRISLILIYV